MKMIKIIKADQKQIKFRFPVVTNVQEVEELLQEYDLAYKFEDAEGPYPSLIVTGNKQEIIRFAKEVMTGDWENDEDAKEFVNKFIPELNKLVNVKNIKAGSIQKDIEKIVNQNLNYDYMGDRGMVNPSPLLKKYENMYGGIRPKDIDYGAYDGIGYIKYVSQGCDDADAMFNMIFEAISKNPTLEKMYQDGKFTIQVCSRDNWGQWTTFTNSEKEEFDLDDLLTDAETLFTYDEDHLDYEFIQYMGYKEVGGFDLDDIKDMIRKNPEKAEKFIRQYIN